MLLLIDNYDSFTYNLYALFKLQGAEVEVVRENERISLSKYSGLILSPGPSIPLAVKGALEKSLSVLGKKPIFGVCLGMQIIAHLLGCEISRAKTIQHGKTDKIIKLKESIILKGLPDSFIGVRYHSLSVKLKSNLLEPIAVSTKDGELMAVENRDLLVFGVQFHPESILSEYGELIAKNFLEVCYGS